MFFYISSELPRHRTPVVQFDTAMAIDNVVVRLDKGWTVTEHNNIIDIRKGYSIECPLADVDVNEQTAGNYCILQYHKPSKTWTVYHDNLRGFPIYYNESVITNLKFDGKSVRIRRAVTMENGYAHSMPYDLIKVE